MVASMKRSLSDSDCDYIDDSASLGSPSNQSEISGFCTDRKRRRGLIEKKRRDRINSSLNQLKSLIPMACERQSSTKLEKSEILQLAVEHIQDLNAKESMNARVMANDYRVIGYRECIEEVMSYLCHVEGISLINPLHSRINSHLHKQATLLEQARSSVVSDCYSLSQFNPFHCNPINTRPVSTPDLNSYALHHSAEESFGTSVVNCHATSTPIKNDMAPCYQMPACQPSIHLNCAIPSGGWSRPFVPQSTWV